MYTQSLCSLIDFGKIIQPEFRCVTVVTSTGRNAELSFQPAIQIEKFPYTKILLQVRRRRKNFTSIINNETADRIRARFVKTETKSGLS
jgi:hypothetical protein